MRRMGTEKPVTRLAAMPFGPRRILAAVAAVAALGAAGCGSDDDKSIPPSSSDQLLTQLQSVRDQMENGDCALAQSAAIQFKSRVDDLPSDVQSDTKKDLNQLADNMIELTSDESQCVPTGGTGETGPTSTDTDTTTTEEPTTTSTTSTATTTDETTKPEEPQPSEPQPSEPQGGQGSGNVGGDLGGSGGTSGSTGGVKPGGG
jgi:hypothetical protein